jgi:hypothetical protein
VKSAEIKVQVVGEPEREATLRKDDENIFEILGAAFEMEDFPDTEKLELLAKPFKMDQERGEDEFEL